MPRRCPICDSELTGARCPKCKYDLEELIQRSREQAAQEWAASQPASVIQAARDELMGTIIDTLQQVREDAAKGGVIPVGMVDKLDGVIHMLETRKLWPNRRSDD